MIITAELGSQGEVSYSQGLWGKRPDGGEGYCVAGATAASGHSLVSRGMPQTEKRVEWARWPGNREAAALDEELRT